METWYFKATDNREVMLKLVKVVVIAQSLLCTHTRT